MLSVFGFLKYNRYELEQVNKYEKYFTNQDAIILENLYKWFINNSLDKEILGKLIGLTKCIFDLLKQHYIFKSDFMIKDEIIKIVEIFRDNKKLEKNHIESISGIIDEIKKMGLVFSEIKDKKLCKSCLGEYATIVYHCNSDKGGHLLFCKSCDVIRKIKNDKCLYCKKSILSTCTIIKNKNFIDRKLIKKNKKISSILPKDSDRKIEAVIGKGSLPIIIKEIVNIGLNNTIDIYYSLPIFFKYKGEKLNKDDKEKYIKKTKLIFSCLLKIREKYCEGKNDTTFKDLKFELISINTSLLAWERQIISGSEPKNFLGSIDGKIKKIEESYKNHTLIDL